MRKAKLDELIQQLASDERTDEVRSARDEARWRAAAHPELRRALAEHYRRLGDPAQAARWGIVFPGWAKRHEIVRLRLFLLSNAGGDDFVRRYLALRWNEPVPQDVVDLVAPSRAVEGPRPGDGRMLLGCGGVTLALVGLGSMYVVAVGVLWTGLVDGSDESALGTFAILGLVGALGVILAIPSFRGPSNRDDVRDRTFAVGRALDLLDEHPAEGRVMLQSLARTTDDPAVRPALVADARRRGRPADAGRWGCTEDGVTTSEERDAYATLILRKPTRDPFTRLMDLSAAWSAEPRAGDVADVLRRVGATPPNPPPAFAEDLPPRLRWWFEPLLAVPVTALGALLFPASARPIAAGTFALIAASWATVAVVAACVAKRARNPRIAYAVAAVILAAVAVGFAAAGAAGG